MPVVGDSDSTPRDRPATMVVVQQLSKGWLPVSPPSPAAVFHHKVSPHQFPWPSQKEKTNCTRGNNPSWSAAPIGYPPAVAQNVREWGGGVPPLEPKENHGPPLETANRRPNSQPPKRGSSQYSMYIADAIRGKPINTRADAIALSI